MMQGPTQLVLLPDFLLGDAIWNDQRSHFTKAIVAPWVAVSPTDSIVDYSRRAGQNWLNSLSLDWQRPTVLAAFGDSGIIACHAARWMQDQGSSTGAVMLVGSYLNGSQRSRAHRWERFASRWMTVSQWRNRVTRRLDAQLTQEGIPSQRIAMLRQQIETSDGSMARWFARTELSSFDSVDHESGKKQSLPVHHIHGRKDRWIKPPGVDQATLLLQGQHWIALSQPSQVNRWMESILKDINLRVANQPSHR